MNILVSLLAVLLLTSNPSFAQEHPSTGLFVSLVQDPPVFTSREEIQKLITFSKQHHIKTLFVQVYRSNQAWFASRFAQAKEYKDASKVMKGDPLSLLIKLAHEQSIQVHAWLNVLSLGANTQAPILKKYGWGILTRNNQTKHHLEDYKIDNQYFLEPSDPRVRKYLSDMVGELVKNYPNLDGVQLDYIRYPDVNPAYGYSPYNMQKFMQKTGHRIINEQDELWREWKRYQVTMLVKELAKKARSTHPGIKVSTTGCVSYARAREEAFQDWHRWVNEYTVDFVTMMNYPLDPNEFKKHIDEVGGKVHHLNRINIAIGAYKPEMTTQELLDQVHICRQAKARGCVIFHYENLIEKPELQKVLDLD